MTQAPDVITRSSNNCLDNKRRDNVLTPLRTKRRDLQGQWFETANAVILYVYDARKSSNHPYSPSCLARCSPAGGQQSDVFAHNSAWTIECVVFTVSCPRVSINLTRRLSRALPPRAHAKHDCIRQSHASSACEGRPQSGGSCGACDVEGTVQPTKKGAIF